MGRKGMMVEYIFLIGGLVLVLLFISYWQQMGLSLAAERFGTLKIHTSTQVKDVILLLQTAPVSSETCVPITGCDKIAIHKSYVEIWGKENDYFKEPSYLSTALSGEMLDLYEYDEKGNIVEVKDCTDAEKQTDPQDCGGFVTVCGQTGSTFMVCLRSQYWPKVGGEYTEYPVGSGTFETVSEIKDQTGQIVTGTHEKILVIATQTDLTPSQVSG